MKFFSDGHGDLQDHNGLGGDSGNWLLGIIWKSLRDLLGKRERETNQFLWDMANQLTQVVNSTLSLISIQEPPLPITVLLLVIS